MKNYPLVIYSDHADVHFEYCIAARLANVSEKFIRQCEREALIESRTMLHGHRGLCFADVRKLKIIRHLHEDMGLDLEAVDFVLRYRKRICAIQRRLDDMESRMHRQAQAHRVEIRLLRRQLAQVSNTD